MKEFEKTTKKAILEMIDYANQDLATKKKRSDDFTYMLDDFGAICTFMLRENTGFKNKLLKSCYYLSLTFFGVTPDNRMYIKPFDHKKSKVIIKKIFPAHLKLIWEHAPYTTKGASAHTHHFCLFVSIPYGNKAVTLAPQDMQELVNNNYVLFVK